MNTIYIIFYNGELYHGVKKKSKTIKAYTSFGMASGVIKRDTPDIATQEFSNLDIASADTYEIILNTVLSKFEIREITI